MSTYSKFFGLSKRVKCDRCGSQILFYRLALCNFCADTNFETIRPFELLDDWKQKETEYKTCCLCRKSYTAALTYDICINCRSIHPDLSHRSWFYNLPQIGSVIVNHCSSCNAVQIIKNPNNDSPPIFQYFQVGSSHASDKPFLCYGSYDDHEEIVHNCHHEWIVVASTVKSRQNGLRIKEELIGNPITSIMGFNEVDLDHIAYGEKSFWCVKCGNFYNLSPNRYSLLPSFGDIRQ